MARIIEHSSRLSAVRLARSHAVCDLLDLDSFNEDDLYANSFSIGCTKTRARSKTDCFGLRTKTARRRYSSMT